MAGQVWSANTLGGFFASPKLSKDIRHVAQPLQKFRQFTKTEQGYAKKSGESMLIDVVSNVADAGGEIQENEKVPETKVTISQVTVTAREYGQKIPWTGKLEDFSEISLENHLSIALRDSMGKTLDNAAAAQFVATPLSVTPTGTTSSKTQTWGTTAGTAPGTATRDLSWEDCIEINARLKQVWKAPTWDGENFIGITNAYGSAVVQKDPDWKDAKKYADPAGLFVGEIGKTPGIRWIEETNYLSNYLGATTYRGAGVVFGRDAVAQIVAVAEELRADPPTDLGRSKAIGWYALLGFKLVWSTASVGEARAMYITSL